MRSFLLLLLSVLGSAAWATPITYYFEGHTTAIHSTLGDLDPLTVLARDDGLVITNGDVAMAGHIVFDPAALRSGAGGSGQGEVLNWSFSTLGLTYFNSGGAFHYLDFQDHSFGYADEIAQGGYGPDVVSMAFDFDGIPFALGPVDFPISDFIGGRFSTAIDLAWVNDELSMHGLQGVITSLRTTPVPGPASSLTMLTGLFLLWAVRRTRLRQ